MITTMQENMQRKFTKMKLSLDSTTIGYFFSISLYLPVSQGILTFIVTKN